MTSSDRGTSLTHLFCYPMPMTSCDLLLCVAQETRSTVGSERVLAVPAVWDPFDTAFTVVCGKYCSLWVSPASWNKGRPHCESPGELIPYQRNSEQGNMRLGRRWAQGCFYFPLGLINRPFVMACLIGGSTNNCWYGAIVSGKKSVHVSGCSQPQLAVSVYLMMVKRYCSVGKSTPKAVVFIFYRFPKDDCIKRSESILLVASQYCWYHWHKISGGENIELQLFILH